MSNATQDLVDLLNVGANHDGVFIGHHPQTTQQRTFGGQVLAQALMAAYRTLDDDRIAHSLHAYFLRAGSTLEHIEYTVWPVHDGRSFNKRSMAAQQHDRQIFAASASFHIAEDGMTHTDRQPLDVPPPEDCPRLIDVLDAKLGESGLWKEWQALDVRYIGDSSPVGGMKATVHGSHLRTWVKTEGKLPDDLRIHQAITAYLSDMTLLPSSLIPHVQELMTTPVGLTSIDHAIWFHRPMRADEWILYDMVSPSASNALGFSTGRLFQNGELIATCAQEGLMRPVEGGINLGG